MNKTNIASKVTLNRVVAADYLMGYTLIALQVISMCIAMANHSWTISIVVGLSALALPWFFIITKPAQLVTRISLAISFMIYSALFIEQTHGMLEAHFSIFILLAFLLYYRD
jgi:methyl-accepting chemotaxis protein